MFIIHHDGNIRPHHGTKPRAMPQRVILPEIENIHRIQLEELGRRDAGLLAQFAQGGLPSRLTRFHFPAHGGPRAGQVFTG